MEDLPDALSMLAARVDALEQRLSALEHSAPAAPTAAVQEVIPEPVKANGGELSFSNTTGALSVLGKAMLGIAGAYLLRAAAESSALPRGALAVAAILYALAWLAAAARTKAEDWLASTIFAGTSALILAPMLWELTLSFKVLAAPIAAAVVGGFVIAGAVLARKRGTAPVLWVSHGTAAVIALALAIATHRMLPFVMVLLMMELLAEYRAISSKGNGVRALTAAAADAGVLALIYIYAGPQNARADYAAISRAGLIAPGVALFLMNGASVAVRTVVRRNAITRFEAIQVTIAFLLASCGAVYFGPASSATWVGVFCLVLSTACYAAMLLRFHGEKEQRNSRVFAAWSAALFAVWSLMGLPAAVRAVVLGLASPAVVVAGVRLRRPALELHGIVFLLVAAVISGWLRNVWSALAGAAPAAPAWSVSVISTCAVLSYLGATRGSESTGAQVISMIFALLAGAAAAALLVQGIVTASGIQMNPGSHHLAFIRTLAVCVVAIGLAFGGARWQRKELTGVAYAALVLLVVKLLVEDLRHGHLAFVAGSIFLFAVTLIMVPRVGRAGAKSFRASQQVSGSIP